MFHGDCCSNGRWSTWPKPVRIGGHVVLGLLIAASIAVLFGYVTMFLWNAILPEISSLPAVTFWQAVGILLLARLLTGRFSHGHHGGRFRRRHRAHGPDRYVEWWETEGEAAFNDYLRRSSPESPSSAPHER